jgi:hypothetical protein
MKKDVSLFVHAEHFVGVGFRSEGRFTCCGKISGENLGKMVVALCQAYFTERQRAFWFSYKNG